MDEKQSLIIFPNKMRLILSGRDTKAIGIVVSICNGYENESVRQNGISNVVERLLAYDLSVQAARYGGELSTRVTAEHIEITISTVRDNLSKLLRALSRSIFDFNPKIEEFNAAKSKVIQKLENQKITPTNMLEKITLDNLYPKVGLSNNQGTISSVANLSFEETKHYLSKIVGPSTLTLSIVGDIFDKNLENSKIDQKLIDKDSKYNEVFSIVMEDFYGKLIKYKDLKPKYSEFAEIKHPKYKQKSKVLNQDRFEISFPSYSYSSHFYKYSNLLANYLSGYLKRKFLSSKNIYGLDAHNFAYRNNGHLRVQFAVDNDDAVQVFERMLDILRNIKIQGVTNGEFESLKKSYVSRIVFDHETVLSLAKRYSKWMSLKNKLFDLDEELESINDLTYETFKQVLVEVLNFNKISIAHVGKKRPDFEPLKIINKSN